MLSQASFAQDVTHRSQIYAGYGIWSRTWIEDRVGSEFFDFFFGNTSLGQYNTTLHSSGIRQLGYNYRFSEHWMVTVFNSHEHFRQYGDLDTTLLVMPLS